MKTLITVIFILFASTGFAQTYQIDWYVIGSGGGHTESATYQLDGTIGQPIVGLSSSASYRVESGFWVGAGAGPSGYEYLAGDANMVAETFPPALIGGDVTWLVNYFRGSSAPCILGGFYAPGDTNGDCAVIGGDVTWLVNYFRGSSVISFCPDYPAAWPTPADVPATGPSGWPACETPVSAANIGTDLAD